MKNNTNNNNTMAQAMMQAMAQGNLQELLQGMAQAMFLQGMAQGAQAKQAQAMGAGDAGKALPVQGKAQGKGKAQAQAQGIAWKRIDRQNERQTVYDVRQAMVQGNKDRMFSLVKAWLVLNEKDVPADDRVRKVCHDMECACMQAKQMSVKQKEGKSAHFEIASMVTVKRAFYCAMRGMPIVETRQDVRPATRGKNAQGK